MKLSHRARLVIGAALLASLGAKAAWTRPELISHPQLFAKRAAELLRANGFVTRTDHRPFGTLIFADAGSCRMMVAEYLPDGTMAEPLSLAARPIGRLRYVWRGEVLNAAPKILPLTFYFAHRELRHIGFTPARQPLIALAASPDCDVELIDWTLLATLPPEAL